MAKFTRPVGMKFRQEDFDRLRWFADRDDKRMGEWCRDKLLELLDRPSPAKSARALMAEILALQNVTINLIYELAKNQTLTKERIQQILETAHASKYRDADERLRRVGLPSGAEKSGNSFPAKELNR